MAQYINFAAAIYPRVLRRDDSVYPRPEREREHEWNVLKLIMGTTYQHLLQDIRTLTPYRDEVYWDYDKDFTRVYRADSMRWESRFAECQRIMEAMHALGREHRATVEIVGISDGRVVINDHINAQSRTVLKLVQKVEVDL